MAGQQKSAQLFVISGPSGSGKTSICRRIASEMGWYYSVSHTTRAQKEGERDGVDYFFVSPDAFFKTRDGGDFLEWAQVYDHYYGTSKSIIEKKIAHGQGVILDVDTQGAKNIKKAIPGSVLIFIKTKDVDELKKRLVDRGRDTEQEIKKRINRVQHEMNHIGEYDHVVLNDRFEQTLEEIRTIIKKYN